MQGAPRKTDNEAINTLERFSDVTFRDYGSRTGTPVKVAADGDHAAFEVLHLRTIWPFP
jgi:hypothetical protein